MFAKILADYFISEVFVAMAATDAAILAPGPKAWSRPEGSGPPTGHRGVYGHRGVGWWYEARIPASSVAKGGRGGSRTMCVRGLENLPKKKQKKSLGLHRL